MNSSSINDSDIHQIDTEEFLAEQPSVTDTNEGVESESLSVELNLQSESKIFSSTEVELSLEDKYLSANEVTPQVELKAEAQNLPFVLVDELLMQEIASIPDRFGFKIGDVADMLEIKQYVLRYWEQEFDLLKPKKASNNQRMYTKKDVENAFLIRKLLYRDKFSIEGARQALKDVKFAVKKEKDFNLVIQKIDSVQDRIAEFVDEIRKTKEFFKI